MDRASPKGEDVGSNPTETQANLHFSQLVESWLRSPTGSGNSSRDYQV